ncbi:unnamed protein product [Linum tenue]|uniref:Auxin response factor n=1 Tax=Linum tenue TaxID=586396 RepID=A0AAV0MNW8_9ROSI|nr:unnamed protein product [Linum tenue]
MSYASSSIRVPDLETIAVFVRLLLTPLIAKLKRKMMLGTKRMAGGELKLGYMSSNDHHRRRHVATPYRRGDATNVMLRKYSERRLAPLVNPGSQGRDDDHHNDGLYPEVWHACAGPLVYVPEVGEYVYYFPQGHIQQVLACVNRDSEIDLPPCNLPAKLLCKVTDVQLKAEAGTDEVFALIVLLPLGEQKQVEDAILNWKEDGKNSLLGRRKSSWGSGGRCFTKKLTPSDTSKHGGFSVPRRQAEECLPPLDMSQEPPVQEIAAKDLHGNLWRFRHIYRGDPKRHLLTSGWSTFATSKRISPGDQFIFVRGENGELRVGVRRGGRLHHNNKNIATAASSAASVISVNCMLHGILANACHAVSTASTFTAYYRPWSNSSEFIVPASQYLRSADIEYSPGTRFRMSFEAEESVEQRIERFEGTIVNSDIVDPRHWPDSEWEGLTVKWDATSDTLVRPERVSHWNIEPIEPIKMKGPTSPLRYLIKRPRPTHFLDNNLPTAAPDQFQAATDHFSQIAKGMLRSNPFLLQNLDLEVFRPQNSKKTKIEVLDELNHPKIPHWMIHPQMNYPVPFAIGPTSNNPQVEVVGDPIVVDQDSDPKKSMSSPVPFLESGEEANEALQLVSPSESKCMLFGVNLSGKPLELPSPQIVTFGSETESLSNHSIPPSTSQSSVSETISKASTPLDYHHLHQANYGQCNNSTVTSSSPVNRTCIKATRERCSEVGHLSERSLLSNKMGI